MKKQSRVQNQNSQLPPAPVSEAGRASLRAGQTQTARPPLDSLARARLLVQNMQSRRALREGDWWELSRWICPWRGALSSGRVPQLEEERLTLFTGIASHAVLKGASGMTSGMTPRNSHWFRPEFSDPDLAEASGASVWLERLDLLMQDALTCGGFYQAIQNFNIDLLWAGCGLLYSEAGSNAPLRFQSVQIGSFCVALDHEGQLEAVCRLVHMPVSAAADKFGPDALCSASRALCSRDPYSQIAIYQLCRREQSGYWPVSSLWWEEDGTDFLRRSGFHEMPFFYSCWNEGASEYGTGPGDTSLADARQLDILERRKLAGLGKLIDPPVTCPTSLKDVLDLSPGGINFMPVHEEIRPILDLSPYSRVLQPLQQEISVVSQRLQDSLMASIFASIPLNQRPRDMSATEFLERKREALQQLGPVISAYEPNVLLPALRRTLRALDRAQLTPPPPESLAGKALTLKVDFISPMANAMRQSAADAARSLLSDVAMIYESSRNAEIFDKIDLDQTIDELARSAGAPGGMVRSDADVARIRQERSRKEAQQQQMLQAMQALQMGKTASEISQNVMGQDGGGAAEAAAAAAGADPAAAAGAMSGMDALGGRDWDE